MSDQITNQWGPSRLTPLYCSPATAGGPTRSSAAAGPALKSLAACRFQHRRRRCKWGSARASSSSSSWGWCPAAARTWSRPARCWAPSKGAWGCSGRAAWPSPRRCSAARPPADAAAAARAPRTAQPAAWAIWRSTLARSSGSSGCSTARSPWTASGSERSC